MCFSPIASFTAAAGLTVIGCAAVAKTERKSDIAFASVPLLFGIQQFAEGVIWLTVGTSSALLPAMTFVYLLFSHIFWPVFLPLGVFLMERVTWRRWMLVPFIGVGVVVSMYFLHYLLIEPVKTEIVGKCIGYVSSHLSRTFILSPYTVATCASCLFSSHRLVNLFGVVAFLSAIFTLEFFQPAFVSVWCFFSAILSVIIYIHFDLEHLRKITKNHFMSA